MNTNDFLRLLKNVEKHGDSYTAVCPAHDDKKNSLQISQQQNGNIGLSCHAMCETQSVMDALGLSMKDLFPPKETKSKNKIEAEYFYKDLSGNVIHKTVKYIPKTFRQFRPDGNGGWIGNLQGVETIPYNLEAVATAISSGKEIYIVEGEKDVESLKEIGLTATTSPMGAGKWKQSYNKFLEGADIVIIPDVDDDKDAGIKHSAKVYKALKPIAKSIKILKLDNPTKKKGFDISDWLQDGGTLEQLLVLVNEKAEVVGKMEQNINEAEEVESRGKFEPKFYETATGYKKLIIFTDKKTKEESEVEVDVAPFLIEPKELITCEDYTELKSIILFENRAYSATLTAKDFTTPKDFKNAVAKRISPSIWFDGGQQDLTKIQKILEKKEVKKIQGVKCSGFHKHNKEWHYVTGKGAIRPDNTNFDEITLLSNYKEIDNPKILENEVLAELEIRTLSESLFKFNSLGITANFMGYISALFLKERLWKEFGSKFPHMAIIGSSGAGKSQTVESIGMQILNMDPNKQQSANQCTKFTGLKNVSSSNTAPLIINEYKPHKMPQWIINDIDNLINNSYDRYESKRGKADLSTEVYANNAPIILVGEGYSADQSAVERIIRLYMTKDESMKRFEKFKNLKSMNRLLNKLGKALLIASLNLSKEEIQKWIDCNTAIVDMTDISVTRGKENISIVLTGLDLLNKSLNNSLDTAILKLKQEAIDRYKADTLDGETNSKTAIGEILELFNQLVIEGEIVKGTHFKELTKQSEIALDIKSIFGVALESSKRRGQSLPLTEAEFTRMLKKESFYNSYKPVKLKGLNSRNNIESRKCHTFDISKLSELDLEIGSIIGFTVSEVFSVAE